MLVFNGEKACVIELRPPESAVNVEWEIIDTCEDLVDENKPSIVDEPVLYIRALLLDDLNPEAIIIGSSTECAVDIPTMDSQSGKRAARSIYTSKACCIILSIVEIELAVISIGRSIATRY